MGNRQAPTPVWRQLLEIAAELYWDDHPDQRQRIAARWGADGGGISTSEHPFVGVAEDASIAVLARTLDQAVRRGG